MTISPPSSIDRTGTRQAGNDLTQWAKTWRNGERVAMGLGANYLLDEGWTLTERKDVKIDWQSSTPHQSNRDAPLMIDLVRCEDIDWYDGRLTGPNKALEAGAKTPRESHHIMKSSGSKRVCVHECEMSYSFGDGFYYGISDVGGPRETAYIWSEDVWVHHCYIHHVGRQEVTVQGVRRGFFCDNDAGFGLRSGLDFESYMFPADSEWPGLEKNGVDGFNIERNRWATNRLYWLANEGSGQADYVTIKDNLFARTPAIIGTVATGSKRRKGWKVINNRFMRPDEASSHFPSLPPTQLPHSGSTGGAIFTFKGYDDIEIVGNGPFYLDYLRDMTLVKLIDCQRDNVHGNFVRLVTGGDRIPDQWQDRGPGIELRRVA